MKIGDDIKVHLPGESPWTIVLEIRDDRFRGKINNKMFHEMCEFDQASFMKENFGTVEHLENLHGIKQGDELWFEKDEDESWIPAGITENVRRDTVFWKFMGSKPAVFALGYFLGGAFIAWVLLN